MQQFPRHKMGGKWRSEATREATLEGPASKLTVIPRALASSSQNPFLAGQSSFMRPGAMLQSIQSASSEKRLRAAQTQESHERSRKWWFLAGFVGGSRSGAGAIVGRGIAIDMPAKSAFGRMA